MQTRHLKECLVIAGVLAWAFGAVQAREAGPGIGQAVPVIAESPSSRLSEEQRRWAVEQDRAALEAIRKGDYVEAKRLADEVLAQVPEHPLTLRISQEAREHLAGSRREPASVRR